MGKLWNFQNHQFIFSLFSLNCSFSRYIRTHSLFLLFLFLFLFLLSWSSLVHVVFVLALCMLTRLLLQGPNLASTCPIPPTRAQINQGLLEPMASLCLGPSRSSRLLPRRGWPNSRPRWTVSCWTVRSCETEAGTTWPPGNRKGLGAWVVWGSVGGWEEEWWQGRGQGFDQSWLVRLPSVLMLQQSVIHITYGGIFWHSLANVILTYS